MRTASSRSRNGASDAEPDYVRAMCRRTSSRIDSARSVPQQDQAAMRRAAWRESASRAEGAPYRHLAVRVIDQAFRDLAIPAGSAAGQESAREFLAGNSMLHHWCEVADLDPMWLVARATRLMAATAESQPTLAYGRRR